MDFDNILIEPIPSKVSSRSEVNLVGQYPMKSGFVFEGIPVVASNMAGIGTFDVARTLTKNKMLTCLVKTYSADDIIEFFEENEEHYDHVMMSVGVSTEDLEKLNKVMSVIGSKMNFLCMDVANGYMNKFVDTVKHVNEKYPHLAIIAGNVVTQEGAMRLAPYVSVIKVGLGSGNLCFDEKTLVHTASGKRKIKNVTVGDYVLTHAGNYKSVLNVFKNKTTELININDIVCTPEHKFYVVNKKDRNFIKDDNYTEYAFWVDAMSLDENKHLLVNLLE